MGGLEEYLILHLDRRVEWLNECLLPTQEKPCLSEGGFGAVCGGSFFTAFFFPAENGDQSKGEKLIVEEAKPVEKPLELNPEKQGTQDSDIIQVVPEPDEAPTEVTGLDLVLCRRSLEFYLGEKVATIVEQKFSSAFSRSWPFLNAIKGAESFFWYLDLVFLFLAFPRTRPPPILHFGEFLQSY